MCVCPSVRHTFEFYYRLSLLCIKNTIQTSDVSNADDVNDEDDDDDRLTWIPNINYNLDDDDNTFQTC